MDKPSTDSHSSTNNLLPNAFSSAEKDGDTA